MSFDNQSAAQRLAMCNDIGEAAYVDSLIAAALVDTLRGLPTGSDIMERLSERYGIDPQVSPLHDSCCGYITGVLVMPASIRLIGMQHPAVTGKVLLSHGLIQVWLGRAARWRMSRAPLILQHENRAHT